MMLGKFISLSLGDFPPGLRSREMDFLGRPEVGSPAANAGDTWAQSLIREVAHTQDSWAYATATELSHCRAHVPQLLKPMHLELVPETGGATAVRGEKKESLRYSESDPPVVGPIVSFWQEVLERWVV